MKRPFKVCIAIVSVVPLLSSAALCESASYDRNVIAEYDMRDYGEHWNLPLTLYGDTHRFLVDTGRGRSVFDKSLRHLLGVPFKDKASVADKALQLYAAPEAHVGKCPMDRRAYVACANLAAIKEGSGGDVAGVLGCEFLCNIVQFDFERAYLRFLTSVPKSAGLDLAFAADDVRPHCRCSFDARGQDSFVLASGSLGIWSVSLREELFQGLVERPSPVIGPAAAPSLVVTGTTRFHDASGAARQTERGILRRLGVGKLSCEYVRVRKTNSCELGMRFMSRFIVTIDFPSRAIHLKPIEGSDRDETDAGLVVVRRGNRTFVERVDPVGRAGGLSLAEGDELIRLNGVQTQNMNLFELRRIIGREDHGSMLDVRHADGTEATVRIPRRD